MRRLRPDQIQANIVICPQYQRFNDGQWGDLEEWIAGHKLSATNFIPGWADAYEQIRVTIGPIFDENRDPLESMVEVPNTYYCLIVDEVNGDTDQTECVYDGLDHGVEAERSAQGSDRTHAQPACWKRSCSRKSVAER